MNINESAAVNLALRSWTLQIERAKKLFNSISDEQLQQPVAPNRNTGTYLLGHLTAYHDALFPLLGLGEKLFPELENPFLKNPDNGNHEIAGLREKWETVNTIFNDKTVKLSTEEWLQRHNDVSEADFIKEPTRNKLNVLLSRTSHLAYHLGQLAFLKNKQTGMR